MRSGTSQSPILSFLDIDQGKKDKQRESVEVCGAANVIVTNDSELEVASAGDCIKVTSTTHGTAKLGVTKKGHNPRRFAFTGHLSVACVLK